MIIHRLQPKHGIVAVTAEDLDDLWRIRRLVSRGDLVSGESSRSIKKAGEFARPDKGERIRVVVTVRAESITLDSSFGRLRISGPIVSASEESVPKGSYHPLNVTPGCRLGMKRQAGLGAKEIDLLRSGEKEDSAFVVVALDRREAGFGRLAGTRLHIYPSVESGLTGKLYAQKQKSFDVYFNEIEKVLLTLLVGKERVFIVGPGDTKRVLSNRLEAKGTVRAPITVLEGVDLTGEDGVYVSLRSPALRKAVQGSKLEQVSSLLEEALTRIGRSDARVTLAFKDTLATARLGAVQSAAVSDRVFELGVREEDLVELFDAIESHKGRVFLVDATTDLGVQTSRLGGAVGILRFPVAL